MKEIDQQLYVDMMKMYSGLMAHHERLVKEIHETGDAAELADQLLVIDKVTKLLDDVEKKMRGTRDLAERLLCILWVKDGDAEPIRTEYVTASPKVRMAAQIPKKGTPEYESLVTHLGIRKDIADGDVVRPHWPGVVEYLTDRLTRGLPLPEGIDPTKTYAVYSVALRPKKGITE